MPPKNRMEPEVANSQTPDVPTTRDAGRGSLPPVDESQWTLPSGQDLVSFALATGIAATPCWSPHFEPQDPASQGALSCQKALAGHGINKGHVSRGMGRCGSCAKD